MGPVLGIGQVVHELVQYISRGGRQVYPFRCDHVIHKLVQHISTEGGSEQEGDLSFKVFLYKGLQYMLSCMVILDLIRAIYFHKNDYNSANIGSIRNILSPK